MNFEFNYFYKLRVCKKIIYASRTKVL